MDIHQNNGTPKMFTFLFNLDEGQISIIWLSKYFQVIISTGFSAKLGQASATPFLLKYVCASFFKKCLLLFCFQRRIGCISISQSPQFSHIKYSDSCHDTSQMMIVTNILLQADQS